ncbi:MAG: hypothetical protein M3256_25250 [Actinomycetota bacterium]|nr:hypothetical protein [Actinomycetota bacterium]MDQ6949466.1 hypothetical protein [Actinomycetota bacterium]
MSSDTPAMLAVIVLVIGSTGVAACGSAPKPGPRQAVKAAASRTWMPPSVAAMRISTSQSGGRVPLGTVVQPAAFKIHALPPHSTTRVFADSRHGYALAFITSGTYPATTIDGGKTWRVDGPAFHIDAAQGGLGVGEMGVASDRIAFAWGGVAPDSVIDLTTDGGKHWWRAFLPGFVLFVAHEGGTVVANVDGSMKQGRVTHTGLWAYGTKNGRIWTYVNTLSPG